MQTLKQLQLLKKNLEQRFLLLEVVAESMRLR